MSRLPAFALFDQGRQTLCVVVSETRPSCETDNHHLEVEVRLTVKRVDKDSDLSRSSADVSNDVKVYASDGLVSARLFEDLGFLAENMRDVMDAGADVFHLKQELSSSSKEIYSQFKRSREGFDRGATEGGACKRPRFDAAEAERTAPAPSFGSASSTSADIRFPAPPSSASTPITPIVGTDARTSQYAFGVTATLNAQNGEKSSLRSQIAQLQTLATPSPFAHSTLSPFAVYATASSPLAPYTPAMNILPRPSEFNFGAPAPAMRPPPVTPGATARPRDEGGAQKQ